MRSDVGWQELKSRLEKAETDSRNWQTKNEDIRKPGGVTASRNLPPAAAPPKVRQMIGDTIRIIMWLMTDGGQSNIIPPQPVAANPPASSSAVAPMAEDPIEDVSANVEEAVRWVCCCREP